MIRVLHVFEFFDQGGIENLVMNIYRNIDRNKYSFDFAFINRNKGCFDEEAIGLGANIYYFDTEEKTISNYYKSLKRIIHENGPYDVVHSHMYYFSGVILLISRLCGVKIRIAHSHETLKGRKPTIIRNTYEKIMRLLIRMNATHLLGCSDLAGKYVFGKHSRYTVLYNGIDVVRFRYNEKVRKEMREKLNLTNNKVLINVGRLNVQKNHHFMLDFFEKLVKIDSSYMLILIGTGNLLEEIKEYIRKRGLSENVMMLSNIYNVEEYYCAADCFVLPSKYEGMPIVSVEAQCSGLPSLLSDKITKEVGITDRIEYLSIDNNAEEWANKINQLISLDVDRSKYAELIQNSPFDINKTVKDLCEIYGRD